MSKYSQIEPGTWQFEVNEFGKPQIKSAQNNRPLYFNLSHSGTRLVVAISNYESTGVDIEFCKEDRRLLEIADRYFSPSEVEELRILPPFRQLSRFYELWTLKEAYIKACGLGLAIPLQQFSYGFPNECRVLLDFAEERNDDPSQWQVWQFEPGGPYELGLAIKSGNKKVAEISSSRLLSLNEAIPLETKIIRNC